MSRSAVPYEMTPEAMMKSMNEMMSMMKDIPAVPVSPLMAHPTAAASAATAMGLGMASQMVGLFLGSMQGAVDASRRMGVPMPADAFRIWDFGPAADVLAPEAETKPIARVAKPVEKVVKAVEKKVEAVADATKRAVAKTVETADTAAKAGAEIIETTAKAVAGAEPVARRELAKKQADAVKTTVETTGNLVESAAKAPAKAVAETLKAADVATTALVAPAKMDKPSRPDDLKLIAGVGPKLEQVLNGLGIWTFGQIAAWTADEVAWVDDYLQFSGRIARDNWIEQARGFAKT